MFVYCTETASHDERESNPRPPTVPVGRSRVCCRCTIVAVGGTAPTATRTVRSGIAVLSNQLSLGVCRRHAVEACRRYVGCCSTSSDPSDWPDSNRRPPDPQSGALTKLRHNPFPAWGWIVRHPTPRREFPPLGVPEQAPERFHGGRTRNRTCRRPPDEPPTPSTNVGGAVGLTLQGRYPAFGGGVRRQHSHRVPSRVSRIPWDTPTPRERCGALCGLGGGRTRCLRVANATLYRLSYKPLASPRSHSPQGGCALSNPPPKGCGRAWRARPLNRSLRRTPSWEGGNRTRVWLTAVFPIQLPPRRPVPSSTHCSGFRTVRFDVSTPSANGA